MATIVWTEPALSDLDAIADYIALDKPDAASRMVQHVFRHVELLEAQPELGARIRELPKNTRYRQLLQRPCRVFYRFDKVAGKIYILGVMRTERLFRADILQGRDSMRKGGQ
jgi:plasmid stabilization system protein ParE